MKDGMMNRCESANRSWRHLAPKVLVCLGISLLSGYTAASATGDSQMVESQKIAPADLPERWSYLPEYQIEAPSADDCWWTTFGQAPLDSLIKAGMANNYNVSAAWHRSMAANEAEAAVKNAHAALQTARTTLGYCTIRAPFSGHVGAPTVVVGDYVAGEASPVVVTKIVNDKDIYVNFGGVTTLARPRFSVASPPKFSG